ncbi:divalent cation transporter [Solibacillus silvestris]|nr:ZIP family metal transporter [Solibacillus silvestris]OBW59462.1 divalent cation transporter [Solibacillus silvestris]
MWLLGFLWTSSGIFIGGMIAWLFKGIKQRANIIYALCAGVILGLISFEILPEAIESGGWLSTIIGFVIGMMVFTVLHGSSHFKQGKESYSKEKYYIRTGLLLMLSFAVHNFPIGITLGANQEPVLTKALLQTLLFHSIPEGIILFIPLILAGLNIFTVLLISFLVSVPVALGVFIGSFFSIVHPLLNTAFMSFAMGMIFIVTVSEILYPALNNSSVFKILCCTLIGFGVIGYYLHLL